MTAMRRHGTLKSWQPERGFGFIAPTDGEDEVFVHISEMGRRPKHMELGMALTFQLGKDRQGRVCAVAVRLVNQGNGFKQLNFRTVVVLSFVGVLALLLVLGLLPPQFLGWYGLVGMVTYWLFIKDKKAAQKDHWRTPESTLQFFSLIGGWPGALLAQQKSRHKTQKTSFNLMLWLGILAHMVGLAWLLTASGQQLMRQMTSALE